jgi:hypothetical protein
MCNSLLNIMTAADAKKKWCRHSHGMYSPSTASRGNRDYAARGGDPMFKCLAAECMAWVTTEKDDSTVMGYCGAEGRDFS